MDIGIRKSLIHDGYQISEKDSKSLSKRICTTRFYYLGFHITCTTIVGVRHPSLWTSIRKMKDVERLERVNIRMWERGELMHLRIP